MSIHTTVEPIAQTTLATSLLQPRSVAIVGASDDPAKTTGRPQRYLRQAGFAGNAYFINPRRETVQGERAYASLSDLPEVPEHVYIVAGSEIAVSAVEECARLGVRVATILSAGFGEAGEAGAEREARLLAAARSGSVRLVGTSSLGVVNPRNGLMLTSNAAFGEPDTPVGGLFVASQSGSVIGALVSRARQRGVGFAGLVSTGGEADLSVGEICSAVVDDPGVTSFALFLESMRSSAELADFARLARAAGKPVTVYKLGRSDEAAQLSVSHTGALAGEDAEAQAFFDACGFARVDHFEGLIEAPPLLERIARTSTDRQQPRIGVVTTTGGGAALMVDQLAVRGLTVVAPSAGLVEHINTTGADVPQSLIIDLGLAGAQHEIVSQSLAYLQDSGEYDLIVFVIGSSARLNPELAVQAIADSGRHSVPVVAFALPDAPTAAELLQSSGVPAFRTPESCADAVRAVFSSLHASPDVGLGTRIVKFQHSGDQHSEVLDELASQAVLGSGDIAFAPGVALSVAHIDTLTRDDLPLQFPVVLKALSAELPHKSDVGGVRVGIGDFDELCTHIPELVAQVRERSGVTLDRVLVQQMIDPGIAQALVGYRVSADVGPLVVLSTGGVLAELFSDSSVRLAPVDRETAGRMIDEVRGLTVIQGFRGSAPGDREALVDTIVAISQLAQDASVVEAEVNPLIVGREHEGCIALDALVRQHA